MKPKPKSKLKELRDKREKEIAILRSNCKHKKKHIIKTTYNYKGLGPGVIYPSVEVICRNCGSIIREYESSMKPKSELKELWNKYEKEVDDLRSNCKHEKKYIEIIEIKACVLFGDKYPSVEVICRNCGMIKRINGLDNKKRKAVKKTMEPQGFKDERVSHVITQFAINRLDL